MFNFPPVPTWEGFHPLIIHFPVALLLVAPFMIVLALIFKSKANCYYHVALILLVMGTIGAYISVMTGESAALLVDRNEQITKMLTEHNLLGEATRNMFTALTVIYAGLLYLPKLLKKELKPRDMQIAMVVFLALCCIGCLLLSNTAHAGGRLVHQLGVRALIN